jgi:L-iditol 2-dehydrogenase
VRTLAAMYYASNDLRIEEVELPPLEAKGLLLKVKACGICGADVERIGYGKLMRGQPCGGHEISGVIVDVGSETTDFRAGDRVVVIRHIPCYVCYYCAANRETLCESYKETRIYPGGYSKLASISGENVSKGVFKISEHVSHREAAVTELVADCLRSTIRSGLKPTEIVHVIGGGPAGLIHLQIARIFGAEKVILSEHHDSRVNTAEKLGADLAFNTKRDDPVKIVMEATGKKGADVVFVTSSSVEAFQQALQTVRRGGRVMVFGSFQHLPTAECIINPRIFSESEVTVTGIYSYRPADIPPALNLIASGKVNVKDVITHSFRLERFAEAFKLAAEGKENCLKVVIEP